MNPSTKYIFFLLSVLGLASCKKDSPTFSPLASLNVANSVIDGRNVKLNTNVRDSATLFSYKLFQLNASTETQIKLSPSNNAATSYYNQVQNVVNGGIYSLFLTGSAAAPDAVFVKDEIPPFSADSIIRVRIINCSPGSPAVNVNLSSSATTPIFTNLGYKALSAFVDLPFKTLVPSGSNIFQVKNASGTLLGTYTLPATGTVSIAAARFKNITLVIRGIVGIASGPNAFGVYAMPNY